MRRLPPSRRRASGFTLVEILVVMTLMSVVMLALGSAMRTLAQTEERVDARLARADEMRIAVSFLSTAMERISARRTPVPGPAGSSPFLFSGTPDAVMWVGVMPARYGAGGRYFFRLSREPTGQNSPLVIRFSPWDGAGVFPDWNSADSRVLVPDAAGLQFAYGDEEGASTAWVPEWSHPTRLPARIRISLRTPAVEWPQLTLALRQLPASDNGRGGFSLGPE